MLSLRSHLVVVDDLHGNLVDLIRIFVGCGNPENTQYLFLGDYVDRGPYSIEVVTLLFALVVKYPRNFFFCYAEIMN